MFQLVVVKVQKVTTTTNMASGYVGLSPSLTLPTCLPGTTAYLSSVITLLLQICPSRTEVRHIYVYHTCIGIISRGSWVGSWIPIMTIFSDGMYTVSAFHVKGLIMVHYNIFLCLNG